MVLGDGLVRQGHITAPRSSKRHASTKVPARLSRGWLPDTVRPGVDSPWNPGHALVLAGFPKPVVNVEVFDGLGRLRYRIDLAWPSAKIAVEYDGRHHQPTGWWTYDIRRREELEAEGWRFLVLTAPDIYRTPGTTLDRAESLLAAGGLRGPAVLLVAAQLQIKINTITTDNSDKNHRKFNIEYTLENTSDKEIAFFFTPNHFNSAHRGSLQTAMLFKIFENDTLIPADGMLANSKNDYSKLSNVLDIEEKMKTLDKMKADELNISLDSLRSYRKKSSVILIFSKRIQQKINE